MMMMTAMMISKMYVGSAVVLTMTKKVQTLIGFNAFAVSGGYMKHVLPIQTFAIIVSNKNYAQSLYS